jgi:hypothetical protein
MPRAFLVFLLVVATPAEQCNPAEIAQLKEEIAELKSKLATSTEDDSQSFSVVGATKKVVGLGGAITEHLLAQTTIDEQVLGHIETAKSFASKSADQIYSVDYDGYVQKAKTTMAPHLDTAATAAKPIMEQYVNPAWDKASVHLEPAMKKVRDTYDTHLKPVQDNVLPALKRSSSQAFDAIAESPKHVEKAHSVVGDVMARVFDSLARVAPAHAKSLPTDPMDRLLTLLLAAFVIYNLFFVFLRLARWTFYLVRLKLKIAFKGGVVFPLKTLRMALRTFLFFATGFYCCGLCRSKKSAQANKVDKTDKAGEADAKKEPKKKGTPASAAELAELLTLAQKEKKLEAAAQNLAKLEKNGTVMSNPKHMAGKTVTKEALKKAIGKFKELDIKKLVK